jgi:DNA polymerase-3 subunit gamma/tau
MLVIRLIHLKDMPNYESLLSTINESNSSPIKDNIINNQDKKVFINEENTTRKITKDQIKNLVQTKPKDLSKDTSMKNILSFEDLIKLASEKREGELKYDLERNVNLVKFSEGKIDISFNEKLGKNFVRNLSEKLNEWIGKRWLITLTKQAGNNTYREMQIIKQNDFLENEKKGETYKKLKNIFPDAELLEVSKKE